MPPHWPMACANTSKLLDILMGDDGECSFGYGQVCLRYVAHLRDAEGGAVCERC